MIHNIVAHAIPLPSTRLGLVDNETPRFSLLDGASLAGAAPPPAQPPPPGLFTAAAGVAASLCALVGPRRAEAPAQRGATAREGGPPRGTIRTAAPPASTVLLGPDAEAEAAEAEAEAVEASEVRGLESAVLDPATQRALYRVLHPHVTSIVHEAALRRHASAQACTLPDVLRLSELAGRIFLMAPATSRSHEIARDAPRSHEMSPEITRDRSLLDGSCRWCLFPRSPPR